MLKNKRILLVFILGITLLLIPSIVNAKATQATETTKTSTGVDVKWEYELDSNNEIVALMCANKADVTGTLSIPSTIDGHTVKKLGAVSYDHTNKYYGDGTFEACYGLQGVTIPNTIKEIGNSAFDKCKGLKDITIPNNVTRIGSSAFAGCSGVITLSIGTGVTSIGTSAFQKCTGLKQLIIPNNVTSIGESAFFECSGITSLTLSNNISIINDRTFEGCTGLTSVKLPESVTTLKGNYSNIYGAFGGCSNLTKILIPDIVATIEKGALRDCPKLTIYGNDGQVSKQYAEDNKIKFDYIANWDKASGGTDITAPKVESMVIKYSSVLGYWDNTTNKYSIPTGGKIQIIVTFSEDIKGTVPTLKIKCGDGEERTIKSGAVSGKDIVYDYTIQKGDVGDITSVSYEGGNITDNAGNKAELSCKTLYVQYNSGSYAYANGTSANVDDKPNEDTTQYLSFPLIIFNGKSSITVRNYNGSYKLYYQFVEVTDEQYSQLTALKEKYQNSEITYAEFLTRYKQILPQYNEENWIETTDGKFEKDLSDFTGTKKFALWGKLVMDTKTVYEAEVYTMDGSGMATNVPDEIDKGTDTDKSTDDTTKKDSKLPQTGIAFISIVGVAILAVAIISKIKYGKYKDIK